MAENGGNHKQQRAIAALLDPTNRTIAQAAEAAGVGTRTLDRWLTDPDFRAALRAAEGAMIDAAGRRLLAMQDEALDAISDLVQPGTVDSVRLRAAGEVLDRLRAWREITALEERLAALEAATYE